jgi:hypothetical protein
MTIKEAVKAKEKGPFELLHREVRQKGIGMDYNGYFFM